MGRLMYLKNVATLELDPEKCTGCGMCEIVCPQAVLSVSGKKARIGEKDACMECGACAMNCKAQAIAVQSGVGCANAIINSYLRKDGQACCGPSGTGTSSPRCCC